ncbi:MAG: crossover junction endodeoxyribonuclease RuvC [Chthoniobacterales bacterium]|nr:crossover junction endodeoxyribonuclease RuvC [Chthoniobacterales bacterium]
MNEGTVLGVDPSLRGTGWAVVAPNPYANIPFHCVVYGVIRMKHTQPVPECLLAIENELSKIIQIHHPQLFAIESTIFVQSHTTAINLGAARGAALIAAAKFKLPIHEYAPKIVKQAVVGYGNAAKQQVTYMIRNLCGLDRNPPPDASDAIAVAITCLQHMKHMQHKPSSPQSASLPRA